MCPERYSQKTSLVVVVKILGSPAQPHHRKPQEKSMTRAIWRYFKQNSATLLSNSNLDSKRRYQATEVKR
jgi:hypothetical protein